MAWCIKPSPVPLPSPLWTWCAFTLQTPPLDLQRGNLPSLRVYLGGQARVCPLGKPGDDPGGAKGFNSFGQSTAHQACTPVAGLFLLPEKETL